MIDPIDELATEVDYMRAMIRKPPTVSDPVAHLAWIRLMAKVLMGLDQRAPLFAIMMCAYCRSEAVLRSYCSSGEYENAYESSLPHAISFLRFFMTTSEPEWLKDLARCEIWATQLRLGAPVEPVTEQSGLHGAEPPRGDAVSELRKIVQLRVQNGKEFIIVSHDVLETIQQLLGYADTTVGRVGRLFWYLGIAPVYPVHEPVALTGIVIFTGKGADTKLTFVPAEENLP